MAARAQTSRRILIVTPALAQANNGNWRTAQRWARMLRPLGQVHIRPDWNGELAAPGWPYDLLIALHARRSAQAIARWANAGIGPLVVVLTGTDLYGDDGHGPIHTDPVALASLRHADAIVALQESGPGDLPARFRPRTHVIYQSTADKPGTGSGTHPAGKTERHLRALAVGHLRPVKDPRVLMDAARLLADRRDMLVDHVGAALDPALGRAAQATMRAQPRYRWLGGLSHGQSLRRIRAAHVLVQMSRAEGGAHTIAEAVRNGTPVIATRVPGNVGMLGRAYAGYVPAGDAAALAAMLARCRDEPAFLEKLRLQCAARARRFEPRIEAAALLRLVRSLPVPRQPRGRRTP